MTMPPRQHDAKGRNLRGKYVSNDDNIFIVERSHLAVSVFPIEVVLLFLSLIGLNSSEFLL